MRLFTAIALPDSVRSELVSMQPRHPEIRAVPESQIHMTLRFIGETDKNKTRRVIQALSHVTFRPFDITLSGTGCFPNPESPSIIWAGVQYHTILRELYDGMQQELFSVGVPLEDRSFHPHITLGRIRKKTRKKTKDSGEKPPLDTVLDHFLHGEPSEFEVSFRVDRFRLYQSRLHSGGAIHHCLQEYKAS